MEDLPEQQARKCSSVCAYKLIRH